MQKWEYKTITAHYDTHGKLRFDDIEYWRMPEKLVLSSLNKEGWELVRIVPITIEVVKEIKSNEGYFWFPWRRKPGTFVDKTASAGETYYFKRSIEEDK
jgi:hypothetical protein